MMPPNAERTGRKPKSHWAPGGLLILVALLSASPAQADSAVVSPAPPSYTINGANDLSQTPFGGLRVAPSAEGGNLTPAASSAAEKSHVFKASAGKLYGLQIMNPSGAAGLLMVHNAISAPADGAVTPLLCFYIANGTGLSVSFPVPLTFSVGITTSFSSGTDCTAQTGVNAFFSGEAQ